MQLCLRNLFQSYRFRVLIHVLLVGPASMCSFFLPLVALDHKFR